MTVRLACLRWLGEPLLNGQPESRRCMPCRNDIGMDRDIITSIATARLTQPSDVLHEQPQHEPSMYDRTADARSAFACTCSIASGPACYKRSRRPCIVPNISGSVETLRCVPASLVAVLPLVARMRQLPVAVAVLVPVVGIAYSSHCLPSGRVSP